MHDPYLIDGVWLTFHLIWLTLFWGFIFKCVLKISERGWRLVEIAFLLFSFFSVVGLTYKAKAIVDDLKNKDATIRYDALKDRIQLRFKGLTGGAVCRQFQRTELSPKNFDELVAEFKSACVYFQRSRAVVGQTLEQDLFLEIEDLELNLKKFGVVVSGLAEGLIEDMHLYNEMRDKKPRLKGQTNDDHFLSILLAPILATIALSLRISRAFFEKSWN